jgi:PKD repeat protein
MHGLKVLSFCALVGLILICMPATAADGENLLRQIEADELWSGTVELTPGTFAVVPGNNMSASYDVERLTPLGALDAAAGIGGLDYDVWEEELAGERILVLYQLGNYTTATDENGTDYRWVFIETLSGEEYAGGDTVAVSDGEIWRAEYVTQAPRGGREVVAYVEMEIAAMSAGEGPVADFIGEPVSGDAPLTVNFSDLSTPVDTVVAWEWDFGEANATSTEENPTYTYEANGTYSVSLTVTDMDGANDTETKEGYITVGAAGPVEGRSIYETAAADGNFTTLVAALDLTGLNMPLNETGTYTVFAPTDDAFDALPEGVLAALTNDTAALTDLLSYHVADGEFMAADLANLTELETLLGENVTITSDAANGTLMIDNATVTIADIECTNGVIHAIDAVLIPPEKQPVDFMADPTEGPAPLAVQFSDLSTVENITAWAWDFGAGNATSTEQDPVYVYETEGVYTVSLTVTDAMNVSYTEEKTDYITVANETTAGAANFTADVTSGDVPLTVQFNDTSTVENVSSWFWDFGNGFMSVNQNPLFTYHEDGTYTVTLTVTDAANTSYTEVKEGFITVGAAAPPEPALSIYETAAAEGNFTTLVAALDLTGLNTTFNETGAYTVFAPTDDAFDALPEGVLAGLINDTAALADVLSYHAADGEYMAADLANLTELETLLGENVTITSDAANGTLMVDNATVIIADIECTNGVIHAIDEVLLPPATGM